MEKASSSLVQLSKLVVESLEEVSEDKIQLVLGKPDQVKNDIRIFFDEKIKEYEHDDQYEAGANLFSPEY